MNTQHTVLVTGGSGFLGSVVCHRLAALDHTVINIDRDRKKREVSGVTLYPFDIGNPQVDGIIQLMRPDVIIHLAADTHPASSVRDPGTYYENNVANTVKLMQSAVDAGVKHVIFASSSSVYGDSDSYPTRESHLLKPLSPYGRSKLQAEQIVADFSAAHQITVAALRFFSIAGADLDTGCGYHQTPVRHLIPAICEAATTSEPLTVYGDGEALRDFTHVQDAADAVIAALQYLVDGGESDVFNIGSGSPVSVNQVLDVFANTLGVTLTQQLGEPRTGEVAKTHADISKAQRVLGWSPKHSITDIVEHAYNWHNLKGRKKS
jgi:UDP-glucose 4-epimerase